MQRATARRLPSLLKSVRWKRLLAALGCFFAALAMAGTALVPGTYPFGIAALSAVGGTFSALFVLTGALLGTAAGIPSAVRLIYKAL